MRKHLIDMSRLSKVIIIAATDALLLPLALWLAFSLRLGEAVALGNEWNLLYVVAPLIALPVFIAMGMYRAMVRYMGQQAMWTLIKAITIAVVLWGVIVFMLRIETVPRSVLFIFWLTSLGLLGGARLIARSMLSSELIKTEGAKPVIIYGAGIAGIQLATVLRYDSELIPVAYIDDNSRLKGQDVNGLRVYHSEQLPSLIEQHGIEEVLVAIPATSRSRKREILNWLEPFPVHVRIVPPVSQLTQGQVQLEDLREVELEDLLGREPVLPNRDLLTTCINNKSVMVTGAGGSIGSELSRQIIHLSPMRLVIFELSEYALYAIDQELRTLMASNGLSFELVTLLGSVQEQDRLEKIMKTFSIDTVYHAAAYKHVPLVEQNVVEGIRNNIFGTLAAAQAALECDVETFVLISTDKAVRPTNVMGATKRFSELLLQGLDLQVRGRTARATTFCMVRFGNVLGSSGSVVPLFREQIRNGGPVTVTHPDIIRYFMTIPEASQLVIQAGAMASGGDVFVLDMGEPVLIADLARKMIHLMGFEVLETGCPDGDIVIEYSGLRPGEKLFEELLIGDKVYETLHPRIMKAEEITIPWSILKGHLSKLERASCETDCATIRAVLLETVNGYQPNGEIEDTLWSMGVEGASISNRSL